MAAPATCPVALRARIRRCRFAHPLPIMVVIVARETAMETESSAGSRRRCIGLDVHREFAQVAIWQGGLVTQAGRFATTPEGVRAFADGLGPADEVLNIAFTAPGLVAIGLPDEVVEGGFTAPFVE